MNNVARASLGNLNPGDISAEEKSRRINLLRTVARFMLISSFVLLVGCLVALFFVPDFPLLLVAVDVITMFAMLAVLRLLARERIDLALPLNLVSLTLVLFVAMYFLDGARGPAILLSPLLMLIAGIIGERRYSQPIITIHIVLYIVFMTLEVLGVFTPYQMSASVSSIAWVVIFIMAATMMVMINRQFIASQALALFASRQREEELAEISRQAQVAVDAQHEAQQQALEMALQLQEVAQEYVTFLERIAAGNYSASLDLKALTERPNLPHELIALGEYINTTVANLVSALNEARSAQQTYIRQSWEGLMEARRAPGGYRYRAGSAAGDASQVEVDENAWLPPMTRTIHSKDVTVETQELALPIVTGTRAQLIGALGVRREQNEPWSEDELALVTTVTDQLAQTLENLRLFDETTRRAAREQMAGEITARIREAVEIETVLERALSELGRAFAVERGAAYLTLGEQEEV
jgi:GAF domain-containing protein